MNQRMCSNCKYVLPKQYTNSFCPICGVILEIDQFVNNPLDYSEKKMYVKESVFQKNESFNYPIDDNEQPERSVKSSNMEITKYIRIIVAAVVGMAIIIGIIAGLGENGGKTLDELQTVTFGKYEQDNNLDNGKEPIEWLVLDKNKETGESLLLSRYALDAKAYNTELEDITWKECSLRKWLNDSFLNEAFSSSQQDQIALTHLENLDQNGIEGNDTEDKVFLLSIDELDRLLSDEYEDGTYPNRQASATMYAQKQGVCISSEYKTIEGEAACWWWLRSPDSNGYGASGVHDIGGVYKTSNVDDAADAVRPAIWVNLES